MRVDDSHKTTLFLIYLTIGLVLLAVINNGFDSWGFFIWSWVVVYIAHKLSFGKK